MTKVSEEIQRLILGVEEVCTTYRVQYVLYGLLILES